jgi:hypothetical protein
MTKRKAKNSCSPRKTSIRESYDRVLILCEGKKTEINYFESLRKHLKLSSINIEVLDTKQTTPDSLLKKAKELYNNSKKDRNVFDRVYIISDKDKHTRYSDIKNNIKPPFYFIYTEPCFEYFLLLHFKQTTKPFNSFTELNKSKDFKEFFPSYNKNDTTLIYDLINLVDTACHNSKNNSYTNVEELITYLRNIKNNAQKKKR